MSSVIALCLGISFTLSNCCILKQVMKCNCDEIFFSQHKVFNSKKLNSQKTILSPYPGDSSYLLSESFLTPLANHNSVRELRYNVTHCSTRSAVKRCIGVSKRRWHCLHGELRVEPRTACKVIYGCLFLHSCAMNFGLNQPIELQDEFPVEVDGEAYGAKMLKMSGK